MRIGRLFARAPSAALLPITAFIALACASACGTSPDDAPLGDEGEGDAAVASHPSSADSGGKTDAAATSPFGRDASAPRDASAAGNPAADSGSAGGASDAGTAKADAGGAGSADASSPTACDWSDPPADVAMWIDESWNAQLGPNIKSRKAWNLDNVMLNKGQLNLCVRWGATSAVPEMVRANLQSTVERWFNDWFKALGSYGCFPYGDGIKVNITGWAVRAGKESLLGQIDPAIPVYTETDGDGEPKCPDACSSFVHWDHKFPDCKGGDANHSDYWLWFDDNLPGGGGAEAVGGDWGLRMPVSTFLGAFTDKSFGICEHEMGHGFGFQDYYDWTGAKPKGGSLMIVGSSQSESPTSGDTWLLRRTWKEMKTLRGW